MGSLSLDTNFTHHEIHFDGNDIHHDSIIFDSLTCKVLESVRELEHAVKH